MYTSELESFDPPKMQKMQFYTHDSSIDKYYEWPHSNYRNAETNPGIFRQYKILSFNACTILCITDFKIVSVELHVQQHWHNLEGITKDTDTAVYWYPWKARAFK
jgi:hypothetical protein